MSEIMSAAECVKKLKVTRDFDLYLDLLDRVKNRYLIILCIKGSADDNAHAEPLEKLIGMGFSRYCSEPIKNYVGIMNNGQVICDDLSDFDAGPQLLEKKISGTSIHISFQPNNFEIMVNGEDFAFAENSLHIIVHDCKKSETVDSCEYEVFKQKPGFYHRNFYYSDQRLKSHIYMPKKYMKRVTVGIKRSYFSDRELGVREVENGIVLPKKTGEDGKSYGGVCDESFNFIAGHQVFLGEYDTRGRHFFGSYTVPPEELDYLDETVLYGGFMSNHPGHLACENFANRIWWLLKNPDSRIRIAVMVEWPYTVWDDVTKRDSVYAFFVKDFFTTMGIPIERLIFIEKPTKFKSVIVPDSCLINYDFTLPYEFTAEYMQVFDQMKKQITPSKYKKVYFTKTKTPHQNMIGEEFFIDFYEKRGFKIIHPEDYVLKEQAEFMYGADEVVVPANGSMALLTGFCKPGTKLINLGKLFTWGVPASIWEAAGLEYYLVNVSGTILDTHSDKVTNVFFNLMGHNLSLLCVTEEFTRYVKDVFNEELDITPEESLKSLLYDYLAYAPKYFAKRPLAFNSLNYLKMADVLQSISDVFYREDFDTSKLDLTTVEDVLESRLRACWNENQLNSERLKLMTDKAKELVDENAELKRHISQLEAEIERLRGDDDGTLQEPLPEACRQKSEADERLVELYRRVDELTKQLLQAMEENEALSSYAAAKERE